MDDRFLQFCDQLHPKMESLLEMHGIHPVVPHSAMPDCGVYLLSENGVHLYTGRSNTMRTRLRDHCGGSFKKAALAVKLARIATNNPATYRRETSPAVLMEQPVFSAAFADAQTRIRNMTLRFVEETDPVRQCLLEIYVSIVLRTTYNSWDTT